MVGNRRVEERVARRAILMDTHRRQYSLKNAAPRDAHLVLRAGTVHHRGLAGRVVHRGDVQLTARVLEVEEVRRDVRHRIVLVRDVREVRDLQTHIAPQ